MRALAGSILLFFGAVVSAFPQFGNVVFPGTGRAPRNPNVSGFGNVVSPSNPFSITDMSFASRLGATVNGTFRGGGGGGRGRNTTYVPYAYPVYYGGYDYSQNQQPNVVVVYPQQQPPQPPVVINQSFSTPPAQPSVQDIPRDLPDPAAVRSYDAPARNTADNPTPDTGSYYLIAFKDHSIYSAVAYWVDGETLHYFTSGNTHNQVSLALVDTPLTERLNRERRIDVKLPVR